MPILTKEFLEQIGIYLDDESIAKLSESVEEELYQRVIKEIIELSDDDIIAELSKLNDMSDSDAQSWLQANVEDLDEIVNDEIAILLGDLAENADNIR
ncbi:hypothetical protein EOM60_01970 [Candidatus Saccharibacteria bacterium]|nr:hypothetical protein [Candidatus Saccharibacteria bacterium]